MELLVDNEDVDDDEEDNDDEDKWQYALSISAISGLVTSNKVSVLITLFLPALGRRWIAAASASAVAAPVAGSLAVGLRSFEISDRSKEAVGGFSSSLRRFESAGGPDGVLAAFSFSVVYATDEGDFGSVLTRAAVVGDNLRLLPATFNCCCC
jgi:hypothetical protein